MVKHKRNTFIFYTADSDNEVDIGHDEEEEGASGGGSDDEEDEVTSQSGECS